MYLKRTRKKNNNYHISPSPQTPGWAAPIRHLYWGNTTCRGSQCGTGMGIIVQCYLCRAKERSLWWRSLKAYPPGSQNFIHVIATHQKFWWASIWVLNPSLKQWGLRAMLSPLAVFSYPLRHGVNSVLTHKKYLHALLKSPTTAEHSQRGTAPSQAPIPLCFSDTWWVSAPRPLPTKTYDISLWHVKRFGDMFSTFTEKTTQTRQFL